MTDRTTSLLVWGNKCSEAAVTVAAHPLTQLGQKRRSRTHRIASISQAAAYLLEKAKNKPQRMTFESSVLLQYWGKNIFSKSPEHSLKATVSHCVWGARTDCFDGRLLRLTRQLKYTEFVLLLVVLRQQCWWKLATIHGSTPSINYYCDE